MAEDITLEKHTFLKSTNCEIPSYFPAVIQTFFNGFLTRRPPKYRLKCYSGLKQKLPTSHNRPNDDVQRKEMNV